VLFRSRTTNLERLDLKADHVRHAMTESSQDQITALWRQLDLSTIYHDWALDGQVVSAEELDAAFDNRAITDATSLPLYNSLRDHRRALDYAREVASRPKLDISPELFRELHAIFIGEPESAKGVRYRKEIPLHRSYFHDICHPSKIPAKMRKLVEWTSDPDEALNNHPIEWAAKFHYRFMRIFPFLETSGRIGRTVVNLVLLRQGFLPAIIHATERQRYYEAIRQSPDELVALFSESIVSSTTAAERFLGRSAVAC
jgi:Fic family protein